MKRILAILILAGSASLTGLTFDPSEPITLELKDARIADVVITLGALANLPVYVAPDVDVTVTLQVKAVPFEKVLAILSSNTGVFVRIQDGKLVASRSGESLFAAATLPDSFRNAARMGLDEYQKATSSPRPLFVTVETGSWKGCYRMEFAEGGAGTLSGQIGAGDSAIPFFLTPFAYYPLSKRRLVGLEYGSKVFATGLASEHGSSLEDADFPEGLKFTFTEKPQEGCQQPISTRPIDLPAREMRLEVRSIGKDGADEILVASRIGALAGRPFVVRSEMADEKDGQHRQTVVSGYVARDGRSFAAALTATAIWIDPQDGREYMFVQPEVPTVSVTLYPLTSEGVTVTRLTAGVATPRPLVLRVYGGADR